MVISLVLEEHGLLEGITPSAPEVFLVCAGDEEVSARMTATMQQLRKSGIHARRSYRSTQNVGKLLGEAAKSGAQVAIIFGEECAQGEVVVKNLSSSEQETVRFEDLDGHLTRTLAETAS